MALVLSNAYERHAVTTLPMVQAVWIRRDRKGQAPSWTVARAGSSMVVARDHAGGVKVEVRRPGVLAEGTCRDLAIGVELRPWVTPSTAEDLAAMAIDAGLAVQLGTWSPRQSLAALVDLLDPDLVPPPAVQHALAQVLAGPSHGAAVLSDRTVRRRIRAATGLSPSRLRRVVRVQRARDALGLAGAALAPTAHRLGFTDQAHMTHEFRTLCGYTPGQWRSHVGRWTGHTPS